MQQIIGAFIRQKRLELNYSQQGLCKGICVVSYLSKIENGQTQAAGDIIAALLKRLYVSYCTEPEFIERATKMIDDLYIKLYSGENIRLLFESDQEKERCLNSPFFIDFMLFAEMETQLRYCAEPCDDNETEQLNSLLKLGSYEKLMNKRQTELYLFLLCAKKKENISRLLNLMPGAFYLANAGLMYSERGRYMEALDVLNLAYARSCEEGTVKNMLLSKIAMGNCYSSLNEKELMLSAYKAALNIANALHDEENASSVYYNIAATLLEWGETEEAVKYFGKTKKQGAMYFHKYAICLESLGKKQEALQALDEGEKQQDYEIFPCAKSMYDVVRYRLLNKGYLKHNEYAGLLRLCIEQIKEHLPIGFVNYHKRYLIELLKAERKYKDIYELMMQ